MPYNLKYFLNFKDNASGLPVVVNIYFPDSDTIPLELIPGDNPCTISESNSDEDIFSPIRSKEYRIRIVTDGLNYPAIEDFATNNDNDWKVEILVNGSIWLIGFLLTDQISEDWLTDQTKHYIELIATDNLGTLKSLNLLNKVGDKYVPSTNQYLIDIVKGALNQAIDGLALNIFDNLFEVSFTDRTDTVVHSYNTTLSGISPNQFIYLIQGRLIYPGDTLVISGSVANDGTFTVVSMDRSQSFAFITVAETVIDENNTQAVDMEVSHVTREIDSYQQAMLDMRTFTSNYDTFEDAYTVLTKILQSRNSVLFQHMGEWYIVRISELFRADLINGTKYNIDGSLEAITNASWTADVNESGDIIPVDRFITKSFLNPVLWNRVEFNYQNFDEVFCNQLFQRGAITLDTDTVKEYDIDCWVYLWGPILTPTVETADFGHREEIDPDTGAMLDDYAWMNNDLSHISYMKSEFAQVSKDDKVTISYQHRELTDFTGSGSGALGRVVLFGIDGTHYTLDIDGNWILSDAGFTTNLRFIGLSNLTNAELKHWNTFQVTSDFIPVDGSIAIMFFKSNFEGATTTETQIKDLRVTFINYIAGKRAINVVGDYHLLTLPANLKDTKSYEVFISDSPKFTLKGAIFRADGITLTRLWYELGYPDIQYPIKRFNAIDHYRMSNRNMLKAECSLYKWVKGQPINSVQKITFNNGNANKRFLPAYIRDLNTSNSRFSSLFIEVFDETKEGATFIFQLIGEFKAPNEFDYLVGFDDIVYFNVGDQLTISGTANNNVSVTVAGKTVVGAVFVITFSGGPITDEFLGSDATFNVTKTNRVNAAHEFKYIYKTN